MAAIINHAATVEPTRLSYPSRAELPPLNKLVPLVQNSDYTILCIAAETAVGADGKWHDPMPAESARLVDELRARLPEFDVWGGYFWLDQASRFTAKQGAAGSLLTGTASFSAQRRITQQTMEQYLDWFVSAAARYEALINPLMVRLAQHLGVEVSAFLDREKNRASWWDEEQEGVLLITDDPTINGEWVWFFHGYDCGLREAETGVIVEAPIGFGREHGNHLAVLSLKFFHEYIDSAAELAPLATVLRPHSHDTTHLMNFAIRQGLMAAVGEGYKGYVLTDLGRHRASIAQLAAAAKAEETDA